MIPASKIIAAASPSRSMQHGVGSTSSRCHDLAEGFMVWSGIPISRAISLLIWPRQTRIATSPDRGGSDAESVAVGATAGSRIRIACDGIRPRPRSSRGERKRAGPAQHLHALSRPRRIRCVSIGRRGEEHADDLMAAPQRPAHVIGEAPLMQHLERWAVPPLLRADHGFAVDRAAAGHDAVEHGISLPEAGFVIVE